MVYVKTTVMTVSAQGKTFQKKTIREKPNILVTRYENQRREAGLIRLLRWLSK